MNKLVLVLIFCLAKQSLVECSSGEAVDAKTDDNNSTESIQVIVNNSLLAFKNNVHLLVEQGVERVENTSNKIVYIGLQIRLKVTHIIQTAAEESEKTVFSMVENAIKDGKEASHCKKKISSDGIIKKMTSCIETNITRGRGYVAKRLKLIRDFRNISNKFDGDVKECGVGLLSTSCKSIVLAKVSVETAMVAGKVTKLINENIASILIVKGKILSCQGVALSSTAARVGKLITDTAICIENCGKVNSTAAFDYNGATTTTDVTSGTTTEISPE